MEENITYWSSGLLAISSECIVKFNGTISRTIFREDNIHPPTLFVTIRRDCDLLEKALAFCYNPEFRDGLEDDKGVPSREELLKPINEIYQGFGISDSSQLVGKQVIALYFNLNHDPSKAKRVIDTPSPTDHLIAIRKK